MKRSIALLLVFISYNLVAWGPIGHRTIGHIAEKYLSKKARKQVKSLLGYESLAIVTVWMDDIRSDDAYGHTYDWHWVSIPDGDTYETSEKNPNGDIIQTIERLISELKAGDLERNIEIENIKMLAHLVGDIHMPLHVGNGEDKGGNDFKVKFFWRNSNLHSVWDAGMIDGKKFSYTELAAVVDHPEEGEVDKWQSASVRDWAMESMQLRNKAYDVPEDGNINYKYVYKNWNIVEKRLNQAGVRLAGVLNEIYGN